MDEPMEYREIVNPETGDSFFIFEDGQQFFELLRGGNPMPFSQFAQGKDIESRKKIQSLSRKLSQQKEEIAGLNQKLRVLRDENLRLQDVEEGLQSSVQSKEMQVTAQFIMGALYLIVLVAVMIAAFIF